MNNKISILIRQSFESKFFLDGGSLETEKKIKKQIESFNLKYPDLISDFLTNLRKDFPDAQIENWTHFFNLDRCVRFLVELDEERRYVCQLSIYNYFSVYHCSYHFDGDSYSYVAKKFINAGELEVCDKMYACANILKEEILWLEEKVLDQIVFDFSIPKIGHEYLIRVADVLFTTHNI